MEQTQVRTAGKHVLLFSGGMDSLCAAWLLRPDVLLYCDIGLPEQHMELAAIRHSALPPGSLMRVDQSLQIGHTKLKNEIVPLRNLYFVMLASNYGDRVSLAALAGDTTKDKDGTFARLASQVVSHVLSNPEKAPPSVQNGTFSVELPFKHLTKTQLVHNFLATAKSPQAHTMMERWLLDTRSCYGAHAVECGSCRSCVRKFVALLLNGVKGTREHFGADPAVTLQLAFEYAKAKGRGEETAEIEKAMVMCRG